MVFANEFERLKQKMEESRAVKDEPMREVSESDDDQIFNSSIRQLWQQAVDDHQRNTEADAADKSAVTEQKELKDAVDTLAREPHATQQEASESSEWLPENPIEEEQQDESSKSSRLAESNLMDEIAVTTEEIVAKTPIDSEHPISAEVQLNQPVSEGSLTSSGIGSQPTQSLDFEGMLTASEPLEEVSEPASIESLAQISLEQLHKEIHQLVESVYSYYHGQFQEIFGIDVPDKEMVDLQATKLSKILGAIASVATEQGRISEEAAQAVNTLLPILWKAVKDQTLRVPEEWYNTNLGYLCRYIKSGGSNQKFDPIDLPTAATMLQLTEKELIEIYPKLGGVKLSSGYVFSREKIQQFRGEIKKTTAPVTIELLQGYYRNTKDCLTKLMRIHHVMNDTYDEIRYIRELLLSGIDFSHNRIKQPVKTLIEQRLAVLYQKYQGIYEFNFEQIEVGQNELTGYIAPNIFVVLEQFASSTMTGDVLAGMLEEMIRYIDDERTKMNELTTGLTKNLGQLNIEIEMLKIKQTL